ncbi:hypothetical protein SDC9_163191 [bioreactor metagenome]|uniref:Digeranylgeranylglycerophospholipid reductase n=1 Tax=bioreactor metagenome TaxID=1076179 RepID=A0A645FN58_9ZZZZ
MADGYAAVGDCVGMTMPIMGSGISASIRAGAMLARAVLADEEDCFTRETLWQYETEYMKKLGFAFSSLELIKAVMTKLSKEDIAFLFDNKVFTSDDMTFGCDDISLLSLIGNMSIVDFIDRAKKASANPALLKKMSAVGVNFVKLKSITATFPSKYSENSVERWAERYNGFFNSTLDRIS